MPIIKEHILQRVMDIKSFRNYNRRDFVSRYNEILFYIGLTLSNQSEISKEAITKFIASKYLLSEVAVRRYRDLIFNSGIFVYDEATKTLRLPNDVFKQVVEQRQQQSAEVSRDGSFSN